MTDHFYASFAQKRLWFLDRYHSNGALYNIPGAWRILGALDVEALRWSLNEIVRRHEILRTVFVEDGDVPLQIISPMLQISLPVTELSGRPEGWAEALIHIESEALKPFNLAVGPLLRAELLRVSLRDHVFLLTLHHIVADGWSIGLLMKELAILYRSHRNGEPPILPSLPVQYADYSVWQREWLTDDVLSTQLTYWKQALEGAPPLLLLPTDRSRPTETKHSGASLSFDLDAKLSTALVELSRQQRATLFMTLIAVFNVLLHRYSQQDDISLGYPIAGRTTQDVESLIGLFVNTLVLRTKVCPSQSFDMLLRQVRNSILAANDHQDIPFEKLVEELRPERNLGHSPLFQVMLAFYNVDSGELEGIGLDLPDLEIQAIASSTQVSKFDLSLELIARNGGISGTMEYSSELFDRETVERMLTHYRILLEAVVKQPQARVCDLPMLTPAENRQILESWNQTSKPYDSSYCLHELFEAQATATPDAVAVTSPTDQLSYAELEAHANQLAHILRARGVGPDTRVGVCIERGTKLVIALLGVLKAGGAYVPLDPAYPRDRLGYMLEDASASILLTQSHLLTYFPEHEGIVCLDTEWEQIVQEPTTRLPQIAGPANLAYCIYTSGSTGQPKGVALQHSNAVAFIDWALHTFTASQTACVLASTSICFDLSVFELFVPLARGGHVLIVQDVLALASDATLAPTLINTVPSAMRALLDSGVLPASANTINLAGEPLPPSLLAQLHERSPDIMVWNLYGPTEYTTYATCAKLDIGRSVTIGRPLANTQIYVLDSRLAPVPVGVAGEIYIAGDGLARGYLARPELTAERFIPNPFGPSGSRMYRTGDLGKFQPDGTIDYLGRIDYQVKIRGFRIELGEIENVTRAYPGVADAVIVAREAADGPRLLAYVVARSGYALSATDLRAHAKKSLPDYMLPSSWTFLEALPMTLNGKVDRNALPNPDISETPSTDYAAPRTPTEHALAAIWCEVLGLERVSIHDDFFTLGGHSLLVTRLVRKICAVLGCELSVRAPFEAPTIAKLSTVVDESIRHVTANVRTEAPPVPTTIQRSTRDEPIDPSETTHTPDRWRSVGKNVLCSNLAQNGSGSAILIPGGGGSISIYHTVVEKLALQGIAALAVSHNGVDNEYQPHSTFDEMADAYVQQVLDHCCDSPVIVGYCLGGLVGYELAARLRNSGKAAALLMIDTWPPVMEIPKPFDLDDFKSVFFRELANKHRAKDTSPIKAAHFSGLNETACLDIAVARLKLADPMEAAAWREIIFRQWRAERTHQIAMLEYIDMMTAAVKAERINVSCFADVPVVAINTIGGSMPSDSFGRLWRMMGLNDILDVRVDSSHFDVCTDQAQLIAGVVRQLLSEPAPSPIFLRANV